MSEGVPAVSPEVPSRGWRITLGLLGRLPQGALSRAFGRMASVKIPKPLRRRVLSGFARLAGINAEEAAQPLEHYASINEFFVRELKPGARAWPVKAAVLGSPVESVVGQLGRIERDTLVQAKGRTYSAAALLEDHEEAQRYENGSFITLYLSPRHYHRIHAPIAGAISKARHIPGHLLPVNEPSVSHVNNLFAVNERLVCYLDSTTAGRIAIVAVGAYNVGRISSAFDVTLNTNRRGVLAKTRTYDPSVHVRIGDEIMAFHLGSTVVMLLEPNVRLNAALEPGADILLGQPIGEA